MLVGHAIKGIDKHYLAKLRISVLRAAAQRIADEIDNPQELPGEGDCAMGRWNIRPRTGVVLPLSSRASAWRQR